MLRFSHWDPARPSREISGAKAGGQGHLAVFGDLVVPAGVKRAGTRAFPYLLSQEEFPVKNEGQCVMSGNAVGPT